MNSQTFRKRFVPETGPLLPANPPELTLGPQEMLMSLNCSWKPPMHLRISALSLAAAFAVRFLTPAMADPVRLGNGFSDLLGHDMVDFGTVARVLERADLGAQAWAPGIANCRALVGIPTEREKDYLFGGERWFGLRATRVDCWAVLQLDPKARVETTRKGDVITRDLILNILEKVLPPSDEKDLWFALANKKPIKPLHRRTQDDAALVSLDGLWLHGDWNELVGRIDFQTLAAFDDDIILSVNKSVKGRPEMFFGVRWRKTDTGGEVVEVFPDTDPP